MPISSSDHIKTLQLMQKAIDTAKREKAVSEGCVQQIQASLKKEFGIDEMNITKAKEALLKKIPILVKKIENGLTELEKFDWGF